MAKLYLLKSHSTKWVPFPCFMECIHLTRGYILKFTKIFFTLSHLFESWLLFKLTSSHAGYKSCVSQNCNNAKDDSWMSPKKTAFYFLSRGKELKIGHQLITRGCAFLWKTCYDMQVPGDWAESRDTREDTFPCRLESFYSCCISLALWVIMVLMDSTWVETHYTSGSIHLQIIQ